MLSPVSSTSTKLQVYAFYFAYFLYYFLSLDNSSKSAQEDSYVQGSEILADQVQRYFSQPLFRQSLKLRVKLYPNFEAFLAKGQGRQDCFFPLVDIPCFLPLNFQQQHVSQFLLVIRNSCSRGGVYKNPPWKSGTKRVFPLDSRVREVQERNRVRSHFDFRVRVYGVSFDSQKLFLSFNQGFSNLDRTTSVEVVLRVLGPLLGIS